MTVFLFDIYTSRSVLWMCSSPLPTPQYFFPALSLLFHFLKRISSWICGFIKNIFIVFLVNPIVQDIPHPLLQVPCPSSFLYPARPPRDDLYELYQAVPCPSVSSWFLLMEISGRRSEVVGRGIYPLTLSLQVDCVPQQKVLAPGTWYLPVDLSMGFSPFRSKSGNRSLYVTCPGGTALSLLVSLHLYRLAFTNSHLIKFISNYPIWTSSQKTSSSPQNLDWYMILLINYSNNTKIKE